jgi:hypothetical protein
MKRIVIALAALLVLAGCNAPQKDPLNQFRYAVNDSLIAQNRAGAFLLGAPLPASVEGLMYLRYDETRMEEGEEYVYRYCAVKDSTAQHARLEVAEDDVIVAIELMSSYFHTPQAVAVGSSLQDALSVWPDAQIWYSYVSDTYVLETPALPGVQFVLDADAYRGSADLSSSDMVTLQPVDFDLAGTIKTILIR